ncbi:MAG: hypothetical protein OM95_01880 [Bdellovibrio sp. ArHS]|uniref:TIGR02147 family protein n=1 Tax=Bdellovibrio sp. ArHS TaxID=1569284 RepID=UPI000582DEFD|nr:TIGR02147 family protein [Bdellovibrio sp. ArHS]KHD89835.1 MAG: hypothetical protein OM95_01880 [Bdellovibrio sp. ArHS]
MTKDVFQFTDYRAFIKAQVDQDQNRWGIWAKLAQAASCKPTYLSQAMREKCHLTSEHMLGIARYWDLSDAETDFLLLLLEYARAGTQELRDYLFSKIKRIRKEREDIATRLKKPKFETGEKETLYYSSWFWSALHVMVSIPEYQSPKKIAARLSLPVEFIEQALQRLATHGIVTRKGQGWTYGTADVHIPKDSLLVGVHHNNWRQRAVADSTSPLGSDGVHYTSVYSLSRNDYQHLKEKMLELIEYSRKKIVDSKEEEIICFLCDIFPV